MSELDDLRNEIKIQAAGTSKFEVEAFAEVYARRLEEAEQVFDLNVESLRCVGPRGRRLELLGYAEDNTDLTLTLLAGKYFGSDETLTMTEARDSLSRAQGFFSASVDGWLKANLEISSREVEYAHYFERQMAQGMISRLRIVLITDGVMSERIRTIESDQIQGLKTSYEIWDQRRIIDAAVPAMGSEDIHVDFTKWTPEGLPCLKAESGDSGTVTYISVIPGKVLAACFEEYGSLLLESNVRTFLSARGAVNKGIQATLSREPDRFLAYNNGLTTTGASVEIAKLPRGEFIRSIDRWQIVNGGQTTASISHFLRNSRDANVDNVSVQMKLVIVTDEDSATVVQAVARFANSQNRISGADLFSTHEFHIRMEQISRRIKALAKEGQQYRSGWYYERARGQWENDKTVRGTPAEQKKFELEYPRSQRITKTDWAKFSYCWERKPHLVSKGAQSVFAEFALTIDKAWQEDNSQFGDDYFRSGVAKAIIYEAARSAVLRQDWYLESPGYLANIVAYAIARFSSLIESQFSGDKFDFDRVWQLQKVSESSLAELVKLAMVAQKHLTSDDRPQANVTQWAKQQTCWERFNKIPFQLDESIRADLLDREESRIKVKDAKRQRAMDTGFETVQRILEVDPSLWERVLHNESGANISPMESDLIKLFGLKRGKVPSERQANALMRLLDRMSTIGVVEPGSF